MNCSVCGAAAIDSTVLTARGGVWHKKDREAGLIRHTSIDTEAQWTKPGWHGWVHGWKLHLVTTAACNAWLPLAVEVTPANVADNVQAPILIEVLPAGLDFLFGNQHYHDETLACLCNNRGCMLVTSFTGKNNPYPHNDDGVKATQILHKTRSIAIDNFNEQFRAIFDVHGSVPTEGLIATRRFVLRAVLSISWQFCIPAYKTWTYVSGSKLYSRPLNIYVQASVSQFLSILSIFE